MIPGGWSYFKDMNVLLLQGPVGPFFRRLSRRLKAAGAHAVYKVNFNAGDWLFFPMRSINYTGSGADWPVFLDTLLEQEKIDTVLLFGDCRGYHATAAELARSRSIEVWVFEEGYVRPDFVTMERDGTNGHSQVPRNAGFYQSLDERPDVPEQQVGNVFAWLALWGALYFLAGSLGAALFPHYRHHRRLSLLEALVWVRAGWRKLLYAVLERKTTRLLTGAMSKHFFLVSLQTAIDSQIRVHSRFESIEPFIREVIASFSRHGPPSCVLVFKHHPLDRGHNDYGRFIQRVCAEHGISGRVFYIHDQHLPTLLAHAAGLVVVNSTVGLSGVHHGLAVKALGDPVYDIEGLVFKGELDAFWQAAGTFAPDMALYRRFRRWLIDHTQLNGSFYAGDVEGDASCGASRPGEAAAEVVWPLTTHRHAIVSTGSDDPPVGLSPEEEAA
ncbi:capsular polysaccharide export protein [Burkholderia pyrrocinia]|uniref:Capsular polysaccharide export protein n=2 Tax=Burkholderiaceae TaxID=119060 RepID=A0A318HZH1_BURPY|nr:capsular polysaccharide export protein [Burkholderia pyrrocinia]SFW87873.1 capsular polysaccharide export protein [Burkholderia sp. NFACC33-1]SFY46076.1 capsular polysaccharide export protein [Burkholderia sp. NFPP32]